MMRGLRETATGLLLLILNCGIGDGAPIWPLTGLKVDAVDPLEHNMGMAMSSTTMAMSDGDSMGMQMYFYASADATILFKGWVTDTWAEMLGSCLGIVVLAALYEGLKLGRILLLERMTCKVTTASKPSEHEQSQGGDTSKDTCATIEVTKGSQHQCGEQSKTPLTKSHTVQTCIHFVQVFYAYTLMLVFMTYNVYLCLSVAFGAALGYWCFAWKRRSAQGYENSCH